jgi:ketosteroid isomerase-like protein
MKLENLKQIMKKYGKAWENQDTDLILDCFEKKGIYQESPHSKPYKGYKEIKRFWKKEVCQNSKNIKFKLKKCYLSKDKNIGFAEWECKNKYKGRQNHMVGIMIIKMKNNKITCLNEYWNTK